ncbi:MAG TPA: hypothetical protein DEQ43_15320 [Nocardioides bacterium]|uniref:hypothetical protein n=1 Tax=uncultured Nocardioides sp. TaxID=198441 RepID=UPI000EBAC74D|nr:hypothetical protein [uncultured Nocardioides sp.]HCB05591.1 hypothetical protein [Nocardioides sp.]HRD62663.1 hypothetical protein [Nocardioides sp.]HRK46807.1 hypothetical protein [Nocardioides sp.]
MYTTTTTRRRRFSIATAAIATTAAVTFGAAACGTENGSVSEPAAPAAPAPAPQVQTAPHISADAAERKYAAQERPETVTPPGRGHRPITIP